MKKNAEIKFEILAHIAVLSGPNEKGWSKELNVIRWNDGDPKFDIRSWDSEHKHMGKGIVLDSSEVAKLIVGLMEVTK